MSKHLYRRDGVSVGRRRMPWQKLWHLDIEAKLMQVSLQAAGVYLWLRVLAGQAWNDGAVLLGDDAEATTRDVERWLARKLGGDKWQEQVEAARALLQELRQAGLIVWGNSRTVILVNWALEQSRAPSMDAERKRRQRGQVDEDDGLEGNRSEADERAAIEDEREGSASPGRGGRCSTPPTGAPEVPTPPPPAASTSTPTSGAFGFDGSTREKRDKSRTCHDQNQNEDERGQNRPSISTSNGGRGRPPLIAAGGGGVVTSGEDVGDDIYAMHPVDAACLLTGERGQWARNGFARALDRVGGVVFRQALGEYRQARRDGIQPKTTAGGMLHGIINTLARRQCA